MVRLGIWAQANQQPLIEDVLTAGQSHDFELVMLGHEQDKVSTALSAALGGAACTDLRSLLGCPADVIWLAAPGILNTDGRSLVRESSTPVATSSPPPDDLTDLLREADGGMPAAFIPLMRSCHAYRSAATALESFGRIECVHVAMTASNHHTSRTALSLDAFDLITSLMGEPDDVWAANAGTTSSHRPDFMPDQGHLMAALRYGPDRAASVTVSNGAGSWTRRILVLGEGGRLICTDEGASWTDVEGVIQAAPTPDTQINAGAVIAEQLIRIATGEGVPPVSLEAAIVQECARLSALTGQIEDPQHLRRMIGMAG